MTEIKTEITIHASPCKVWGVLTNFNAYPSWNPFVQAVEGRAGPGERLVITIKPPGKKKMIFKPKIISWEEKKEFSWLGGLFVPGIFEGHHCFELKKLPDDHVQFIHVEYFSGLLKKPIFKAVADATRLGFEQMNQALKIRCEQEL